MHDMHVYIVCKNPVQKVSILRYCKETKLPPSCTIITTQQYQGRKPWAERGSVGILAAEILSQLYSDPPKQILYCIERILQLHVSSLILNVARLACWKSNLQPGVLVGGGSSRCKGRGYWEPSPIPCEVNEIKPNKPWWANQDTAKRMMIWARSTSNIYRSDNPTVPEIRNGLNFTVCCTVCGFHT